MKKNLLITIVILVVAVIAFGVGYYFKNPKSSTPSTGTPQNQKIIKNVEVNQKFTLKVGEIAKMEYETPGSVISYKIELKSITGFNGAEVNISSEEKAFDGTKLSSWPEKSFTFPELNSDVGYGGLGLNLIAVTSDEAVFSSAVVTY